MSLYADTSFLFSTYASDALSARADAWWSSNAAPLLFTDLNDLELRNALNLAIFQGRMSAGQAAAIWNDVKTDKHLERLVWNEMRLIPSMKVQTFKPSVVRMKSSERATARSLGRAPNPGRDERPVRPIWSSRRLIFGWGMERQRRPPAPLGARSKPR